MAATVVVSMGVLGGVAFADNSDPDLQLELTDATTAAPGGTLEVTSVLTNTSSKATHGLLLNMSLPEYVDFTAPNCQETGENADGGKLVSCNISGPEGKIPAGESLETQTPFVVSADAPADAPLGKIGALVVPLDAEGVDSTEDWSDVSGPNADEIEVSTGAAEATGTSGPLGFLSGLGLF